MYMQLLGMSQPFNMNDCSLHHNAKDLQMWKNYIAALHAAWHNGVRVSDVSSGPYIKRYSAAAHLTDNLVLSTGLVM